MTRVLTCRPYPHSQPKGPLCRQKSKEIYLEVERPLGRCVPVPLQQQELHDALEAAARRGVRRQAARAQVRERGLVVQAQPGCRLLSTRRTMLSCTKVHVESSTRSNISWRCQKACPASSSKWGLDKRAKLCCETSLTCSNPCQHST